MNCQREAGVIPNLKGIPLVSFSWISVLESSTLQFVFSLLHFFNDLLFVRIFPGAVECTHSGFEVRVDASGSPHGLGPSLCISFAYIR